MADSVLLIVDVDAGIFPERCVLTGERTATATRVWARPRRRIRPVVRVPVPVTKRAFGRWRTRSSIWGAVSAFGLGTVVMSVRNADVALAVLGVLVAAGALVARWRARRAFWIDAELRPSAGHVVLRRTHSGFDEEARRLFLRRR